MDSDRRRSALVVAAVIVILKHYIEMLNAAIAALLGEDLSAPRQRTARVRNYVANIVPRFNNKQFQQNFRLNPLAFEHLENLFGNRLNTPIGRHQVPVRIQLLATIWLLGTPDSYRSIGERFDLSKSTLYVSALRVVQEICKIAPQMIRWPSPQQIIFNKMSFLNNYQFPDVIGAVDGSYIFCSQPKENGAAYNTRKCRHAIVLQAICQYDLTFIDCFAGYPGSVGDNRIFRNSDIFHSIEQNISPYFPNGEHILGDKAYPLKQWCITPYRDNGRLTLNQRNFNHIHSKARSVIERAFGLLKGRFRRLKFMEVYRHDLAPSYILAACVLHNICLYIGEDDIEDYIDRDVIHVESHNFQSNINNDSSAGMAKREYLMRLLT